MCALMVVAQHPDCLLADMSSQIDEQLPIHGSREEMIDGACTQYARLQFSPLAQRYRPLLSASQLWLATTGPGTCRASSTCSRAATTWGSNCDPAQRRSSVSATAAVRAC